MRRTVGQVKVQAVLALGDKDAFAGQRDARIGRLGDVGQEHAIPDRPALHGVYVLYIQNEFGEALVENAGLHFVGNLRTFELVFESSERCLATMARGTGHWQARATKRRRQRLR